MAQILNFIKPEMIDHFLLAFVSQKLAHNIFEVQLQETNERLSVQRCASCLLEPMPGDEVILLSVSGRFYLTHIVTQKNPQEQLLAARHLTLKTQELKLHSRRLFAKIPFLEALGGQWLSTLKRSFFKSQETVHDLGHYVLDTESMHEQHQSLKTLKAPLVTEKTETHHISTEKFLLD